MSALAFRSDIQRLRAIAIIAVMAFHFNPAWLPGRFIGVDLFLVISGYLITSILLQKKEQASSYTEKADIIFLAASWNWHMESQEFNQVLTDFLSNEAYPAEKYIIGQEPLLNQPPLRNQRFTHLSLGTKAGLDKDYQRTNQLLQNLTRATKKVKYQALDKLSIFKQTLIWQDHLIHYDEHHLNKIGTIKYAKQAPPIISQEIINAS